MRGMEEHEGDRTANSDQAKDGAKNQAEAVKGEAIIPQRKLRY